MDVSPDYVQHRKLQKTDRSIFLRLDTVSLCAKILMVRPQIKMTQFADFAKWPSSQSGQGNLRIND